MTIGPLTTAMVMIMMITAHSSWMSSLNHIAAPIQVMNMLLGSLRRYLVTIGIGLKTIATSGTHTTHAHQLSYHAQDTDTIQMEITSTLTAEKRCTMKKCG